jgi:hypothetical protein
MDPIRIENVHPANPLGDLAEAVNGASDQQPTDSSDEPLRRRRRRRRHSSSSHRRSSRFRFRFRWRLSQAATAWLAILTTISLVGGATFWIFRLSTENADLRSRLSRANEQNREQINRLEALAQSVAMQEFSTIELDSEKFNALVPSAPTPVQRPQEGSLLIVHLRIPPGVESDRWEIILRDQLQNPKAKALVTQPRDNRISLALGNLSLDRYELHAKARGKDATFRYMFSLR